MNGPAQGTQEWLQLRCGWLGASKIADVMAKTKSGPSASRANVMADLIAERLTGVPTESYQSPDMTRGIELEPQAVAAYEFLNDVETETCSFIRHPTIDYTGASPDRLVLTDGLVEVKCPKTATHIDMLLHGTIDRRYLLQMMWQMAVTQRAWCDFVSFCPLLPPSMQLYQARVPRDEKLIAEITVEVRKFIAELNEKTIALQVKFDFRNAA